MSPIDCPSNEDKIRAIRLRHVQALGTGMSNAEAVAYANDPDTVGPSLPVRVRVSLGLPPLPAMDTDTASLDVGHAPASLDNSPPLAPQQDVSPFLDNTGRPEKKAGPYLYYPDREVFQALLAQDFNAFCEYAFGVVRPGVLFKPNWHLEAMAEKLSQVATGKKRRVIINVPPRSLKSIQTSVALPAWFLGQYPWERVIVVSYSDILARYHANDFRRLVRDPLYQAAFPEMRIDRDTDREISTTQRGKRIATSVEGTLTGLGGILIIIDDPLKLGDAMSESVRARVIEWYRSTLLSRGDDKTATRIVVVMQRVHDNDLVGYLIEQGGFEVLNLPAIAQRTETFDLGGGRTYTRQKGELLHPEHEPAHVLAELKRSMGPIAFSAQYQQSPIPPGGKIIQRKWLVSYDDTWILNV